MKSQLLARLPRRALWLACVVSLIPWGAARSQTSTGSIRGFVRDETGAPIVGANVVATNAETSFQRGALTSASGFYNIAGLPPGTYELRVSSLGYATQSRTFRLLVGQTLSLDFRLSTQAVELEAITATVDRGVETKSPEVATNITQEQIESIPLVDRNFLALATLAPGVVREGGSITSGGQSMNNINVFVDGITVAPPVHWTSPWLRVPNET